MSGFIQGQARTQSTLFPEMLDDFVVEDSAVRVIDLFIDELNLAGLGFQTEEMDTEMGGKSWTRPTASGHGRLRHKSTY